MFSKRENKKSNLAKRAKVFDRLCQKLRIKISQRNMINVATVLFAKDNSARQTSNPVFCIPLWLLNFDELTHLFHGQNDIIHSECLKKPINTTSKYGKVLKKLFVSIISWISRPIWKLNPFQSFSNGSFPLLLCVGVCVFSSSFYSYLFGFLLLFIWNGICRHVFFPNWQEKLETMELFNY